MTKMNDDSSVIALRYGENKGSASPGKGRPNMELKFELPSNK